MSPSADAEGVAGYADRTARLVPGLADLHRMTGLLLAERLGKTARILVLGAGGGMELRALATMQPSWRFDGVDPSAEMLELARTTLGAMASRVTFHDGYIQSAPEGPFDGAVSLLTLHFLPEDERRRTVSAVHRRLAPGAPFVVAHHSFPTAGAGKDKWLSRYAAFAAESGVPMAQPDKSIAVMKQRLPVLPPEQDEAILRDCGFRDIDLFYAAFTFKGWVGYRA